MYKRLSIVVGALALTGAIAATAAAVVTEDSGKEQIQVDKRTGNTPSTTTSSSGTICRVRPWTLPSPPTTHCHGLERSSRLVGGDNDTTYTIQVQYAVTNPATALTLDDWHLAVHTNR